MDCLILEKLSNELLLQILQEFSPFELLQSWWNLNNRFNQLILSLSHNVYLTKSNIRKDELQAIHFFQNHVVSLVVTKKWCQLINQFVNLKTLRIHGFVYPFSSSQIKPRRLPHLTHLDMLDDFDWDEFMSCDNHHYARQFVDCRLRRLVITPTVPCQTLRSAKFLVCTSEALASLLRLAPNLINISIGLHTPISLENLTFVSISTTTANDQHPSFTPMPTHHFEGICHSNLRRVCIDFACETTLEWLDSFLVSTPNVTHFSLKIGRSYEVFSFAQLHRIMTTRLPNIEQRNFHFEYCCLPTEFNVEKHQRIGPLFKTMIAREFKSGPMRLLRINVNRSTKTYKKNTN